MNLGKKVKEWARGRAVRGGMLLFAGGGAENGFRFLRNIVLARILAPEAFGAIAIVLAFNALLESFTEVGIKEAIIQNPKGDDRAFLNGAWWFAFGRSVVLYLTAFFAAPPLAGFYGDPELTALMRVVFLSILFNGMMSSAAYAAVKRMDFGRWVALFHGGSLAGIALTVGLAFWMRNVWALAIGYAAEAAFRLILSYALCPFRPGFELDRESTRSLARYSRGMIGLPILTFIFLRADVFVLGRLCTVQELGLYSMAANLARIPAQFASTIVSRVVMPMFSEVQGDMGRVNEMILRFTSIIVLLTSPLLFFVIVYGESLLRLFYGPQYAAMAVPFAIVLFAEWLRIGGLPIIAFYFGSGRPGENRRFTAVRAAAMLLAVYPAARAFGVTGAAGAVFAATLLGYLLQVCRTRVLSGLDLRRLGWVHARAVAVSLCVVLFWGASRFLPSGNTAAQVSMGLAGCCLSYAIAIRQYLLGGSNCSAA